MINQNQKNAAELFDTPEKWDAFLELSKLSNPLQNEWWKKLRDTVMSDFTNKCGEFSEWEVVRNGSSGFPDWIEWRLRDLSEAKHMAFYFDRNQIGFYSWYLDNITNNSDFLQIKNQFIQNERPHDKSVLVWENCHFMLGEELLENLSQEQLAWYAGHETEKIAKQVLDCICKFLTPENAALFKKLAEKIV